VPGVEELNMIGINEIVTGAGYQSDRIKIDPSVVRGLEYYTGPVYEAELTFDVTNEKGEKVVFGSVGGGGRYDGLVSRFMGQPVPATGFSIGVSRLMTALKNLGKLGQSEVIEPSSSPSWMAMSRPWAATSASPRSCARPASAPRCIRATGRSSATS
jgi:histidyl-tRNA synthetase